MQGILRSGGPVADEVEGWLAQVIAVDSLTPRSRAIARCLAADPRRSSFDSASSMAEKAGVSTATVVRFAQSLGFRGWPDFRLELRSRILAKMSPSDRMAQSDLELEHPLYTSLRQDIANLRTALDLVDPRKVTEIAQLIVDAPTTLVISGGGYAAPALVLSHLAGYMGHRVVFEGRGGTHLVSAISALREGDCLVAISFWQTLREIVLATEWCRNQGITTIAVTDSMFSPLADSAAHVLTVPAEGVSFFQSMTACVSVMYGLLAEMQRKIGTPSVSALDRTQQLWDHLSVLHSD